MTDPRRRDLLASPLALLRRENSRPGASDWQLTNVWPNRDQNHRTAFIEGYCDQQSVLAGSTIRFFVSTEPARRFTLDLFRMGYYGGAGARRMHSLGPLPGKPQPIPTGEDRLRECRWDSPIEFRVPADWPSGVYLGKLSTIAESKSEHAWQSYLIFVVRDTRRADLLFQVSDNTWAAYNRWPDGSSFYRDSHDSKAFSWQAQATVSFDRPYAKYSQIFDHPLSVGSGEFLLWEFPLCYWLEQHGYDVTYTSNSDMLTVDAFTRAKAFLSVGHDEYWDPRQYDAALASIQSGVSHLYLSGNSVYGVTPFYPSSTGRPHRIIRREGIYGGIYGRMDEFVGGQKFTRHGPPANRLMGAHTIYPFNGGGDWICTKPEHWIFSGTGMKQGDSIPGLIGWEFHGDPAPIPGLEVVAEGTALRGGTDEAHWTATIYPGPRKNWVFNAATIWWAQGLASPPGHILPWSHWVRPHGPDPRVQRITANLLRRVLQ